MDPEDFDYQDDPDETPTYTSRTLTQGAPILIETLNESIFIGEVLSLTMPGILIHQTTQEITPEDLQSGVDPHDFTLTSPIEAFIPFTSIHYVQSMQDLSAETLVAALRDDLDNYHTEPTEDSEDPSEDESEDKNRWDSFIHLLDRVLKKLGV